MSTVSNKADPSSPLGIHRNALGLAGVLFVLFVAAAGLYSRYGYSVVLRVYEEHQIGRAADRKGAAKLVEFEDYLRVDPANLRMRGLYINQLIELKDPAGAIKAAKAGLAVVPPSQRPIAMLLYARSQIASGMLNGAAETYRDALAALGESGEAHYGLARIAAARGEFAKMREEFERCSSLVPGSEKRFDVGPFTLFTKVSIIWPVPIGAPNNTPDFGPQVGQDDRNGSQPVAKPIQLDLLFLGDVDALFKLLSNAERFDDAPPAALLWRGVYEEEQGRRDAALDFYMRAADAGDALGQFAYLRLRRS